MANILKMAFFNSIFIWQILHFESNFNEVSKDLVEKYISIVLGNGLDPSRQQTTIRINDEKLFWYDITLMRKESIIVAHIHWNNIASFTVISSV